MKEDLATRRAAGRWLVRLEALAMLALAMFLAVTAIRVVHEGSLQEVHRADAIVVFGAAEYSGRPSPVLRARLDHAFELFQKTLLPWSLQPVARLSIPVSAKGAWDGII